VVVVAGLFDCFEELEHAANAVVRITIANHRGDVAILFHSSSFVWLNICQIWTASVDLQTPTAKFLGRIPQVTFVTASINNQTL
jgi:hypothetical protein